MKDTNNQKWYTVKDLKNFDNSNTNSYKERNLSNICLLENAFNRILLGMRLTKSRKINKLLNNDNINNWMSSIEQQTLYQIMKALDDKKTILNI